MEGLAAEKGILMKMVSVTSTAPVLTINRYYFNPHLQMRTKHRKIKCLDQGHTAQYSDTK